MPRLIPLGARVLVTDLEPEVSVVKRAEKAGLYAVVLPENIPKPTSGLVEAVGTDPLTQEHISVGDIVLFARHAGIMVQVEGKEYRSLELREIAHVIKPDVVNPPTPSVTGPESATSPQPSNSPGVEPPSSQIPGQVAPPARYEPPS